ncbi:MAG: ABC transporter permease [Candidatus Aminicenantes bacterium]
MFRNYLRIALRNIKKHKGYSLINILGLATGMACCILIFSYVIYELSYDKYHENADRIYRIKADAQIGDNHLHIPKSSPPMAAYMIDNFPEVSNAARVRELSNVPVKYREKLYYEDRIFFADNSFLDIFTFPLLKGDPKTALKTAYTVVITEDTARRYFGDENPLGKVLTVAENTDFTVTGIASNVPRNSHFIFDMLCSFETHAQNNRMSMVNWLSLNYYTYILIQKEADPNALEQKFPDMIAANAGNILKAVKGELTLTLQPLTSIYLHSRLEQEISATSNIAYVYIFSAIALFILFIACMNFMNLATARSTKRAQEVGMRKVLGAHRAKVVRQFLSESMITSLIACVVALVIVEIVLPLFRSISGIDLVINYVETPWLIPGLIGLTLFVGLVAGSYPAFFLSSFQPIRVLKGSLRTGTASARFRGILVIVQFTISIVLIIGTIITFNQLMYMKNKALGFDKEQILILPISDESTVESLAPFKQELKNHPAIINVAASSHVPGQTTYYNPFLPEGFTRDQMPWMGQLNVDSDFIPTMGIELISGRNFSSELSTDRTQSVIINATAAKRFGWDDPVGKTIGELRNIGGIQKRPVIGVVKDFHIESLHREIGPLLITSNTEWLNTLSVRIATDNIASTLGFLSEKWMKHNPLRPFQYSFLDDSFDAQYKADERLSNIFSYFSILAIFIACLGLFGLASYTAEQRTKEIGIRKVLGATISGIVKLLIKEFSRWVLLANVIAWPLAYFAMKKWLQGFAYRTSIALYIFVLSATIALAIALLTVSYQALRAAKTDPINSLRYE